MRGDKLQRSFASLRMTKLGGMTKFGRGGRGTADPADAKAYALPDTALPSLLSSLAEYFRSMVFLDDDDFEPDEIPIISGTGEGLMEEAPATAPGAGRRNEDIALDLMKFIAMTTGYGRTTSSGVGFQGTGSAAKPEDYADHLLELYGKCLGAVAAKK